MFRGPYRKLLWGLFFLGGAHLSAQSASSPLTAQQLAQRVDKYYNSLHSLRTEFTETFQGLGVDRKESGSLLLRKPGKMRWDYAEPRGKIFVLDSRYASFYTPGDAQAERVSAAQMDDLRSPLRFLLGHTQLQKEFDQLTLSGTGPEFELTGAPKGMQNRVAKIAFGVTADGVIHSISITEVDGAQTAFAFANTQPNVPTTEADFLFKPPAGVPVVDSLPPI